MNIDIILKTILMTQDGCASNAYNGCDKTDMLIILLSGSLKYDIGDGNKSEKTYYILCKCVPFST